MVTGYHIGQCSFRINQDDEIGLRLVLTESCHWKWIQGNDMIQFVS